MSVNDVVQFVLYICLSKSVNFSGSIGDRGSNMLDSGAHFYDT